MYNSNIALGNYKEYISQQLRYALFLCQKRKK